MKDHHQIPPPKLALRIFRWYCRQSRREELEGDLLEMHDLRTRNHTRAHSLYLRFWWDVLRCFKPYAIKNSIFTMNFSLFQSYVTIGLRNAWKNKGPVSVNILGLGLALGFSITVYMIFAYNIEFDRFYDGQVDQTYRLQTLKIENNQKRRLELAPLAMWSYIEQTTGVEDLVVFEGRRAIIQKNTDYFEDFVGFATPNMIDTYDIPMKSGSSQAFKDPGAIYLTQEIAEKYFGDVSPLGETLTVFLGSGKKSFQVAGVFEKIPLNSSFQFELLINIDAYLELTDLDRSDWNSQVRLGYYFKSSTPEITEQELNKLVPLQNQKQESWKIDELDLVAFMDPMNADHIVNYSPTNMRIRPQAIIIFAVLGLLILMIACFNLANTAIALMAKRVKEIGVRKTMGSHNIQIFSQFMAEMLVICALAFVVALLLANVIAKEIWGLFGASFFIQEISITRFVPFLIIFLLCCTFFAGLFPALYAWKFQTVSILNNKYSVKGAGWVQRLFTLGQFTFSIAVLVAGWAFARNSEYLKAMDFGYNHEQLLAIPFEESSKLPAIKNSIEAFSYVSAVAATRDHHRMNVSRGLWNRDTTDLEVRQYHVGWNYFDITELPIIQGRSFDESIRSDQDRGLIVNEAFTDIHGVSINTSLTIDGERRTIVGIAKNVVDNVYSDYAPRPEMYIAAETEQLNMLLVKVAGAEKPLVDQDIKALWASTMNTPYRGEWQEDRAMNTAYRDSNNLKSIFLSIAVLGSLLSLIGIYSLAIININKRKREISIRKILGASFKQLTIIINKPFALILCLSVVAGIVLGMLLTNAVLQMIYTFYAEAPMFSSVLIALGLAGLAVLFISAAIVRPIRSNPCEGLRVE